MASQYAQQGLALLQQHRPDEAAQVLENGLKADPGDADCLQSLARLYILRGERQRAVAYLERMLLVRPKNPEARSHLALHRYLQGDRQALSALREAAASPGAGAFEHLNLAQALEQERDVAGSKRAFQRAAELDPKSVFVHMSAGQAALRRKDWPDALARFQTAAELAPEDTVVLTFLARASQLQGDHARAIEALERAVSLAPEDPALIEELLQFRMMEGDWDEALALARKLTAKAPDNVRYRYLLGMALLRSGELDEAGPVLEDVIARDPRALDARVALAEVAEGQGDVPLAIERLKAALALDPTALVPANNLASLYLSQPDGKREAARLLRRALDAAPEEPITNLNLAFALADSEPVTALAHARKAQGSPLPVVKEQADRLVKTLSHQDARRIRG